MRAVVQRVLYASVAIDGAVESAIQKGLLVFVGIEDADTQEDVEWLTYKIAHLRIFDDEQGVMNRSVTDVGGDLLVVSQFTLHASTKKGNRPSYIRASRPPHAVPMYESFCEALSRFAGRRVQTGIFGADMKVRLLNDGPVTIVMDTKNKE